jgi:hypothetical protein
MGCGSRPICWLASAMAFSPASSGVQLVGSRNAGGQDHLECRASGGPATFSELSEAARPQGAGPLIAKRVTLQEPASGAGE